MKCEQCKNQLYPGNLVFKHGIVTQGLFTDSVGRQSNWYCLGCYNKLKKG